MRHEEIINFLTKLNSIFPMENKRVDTVFETYTDVLLEKCHAKEYDLKKLLSLIVQDAKYMTFPSLKTILGFLPTAEIVHYSKPVANADSLIVLTLPSGFMYSFLVGAEGKTFKELKSDCMRRFGECEIKMYPKGSVLIGNTVIEP